MSRKICFILTETNGLHNIPMTEKVEKKNLYNYARLVLLNYEIGYVKDNTEIDKKNSIAFVKLKSEKYIIKPRTMYISPETSNITQEYAEENGVEIDIVLKTLIADLKDVDIIVSHNAPFHLNTLLAEAVKYNINLDFSKKLIIDIISFYHKYEQLSLIDLSDKLLHYSDKDLIELLRNIFFKLYKKFQKN